MCVHDYTVRWPRKQEEEIEIDLVLLVVARSGISEQELSRTMASSTSSTSSKIVAVSWIEVHNPVSTVILFDKWIELKPILVGLCCEGSVANSFQDKILDGLVEWEICYHRNAHQFHQEVPQQFSKVRCSKIPLLVRHLQFLSFSHVFQDNCNFLRLPKQDSGFNSPCSKKSGTS